MANGKFITEKFLLQNNAAERLYQDYARDMPIIDYHCHLPPQQVADDKRFENMAQIWLAGDHYKWRAMRSNGVDEHYCTGEASDWEKFEKWAETVPYTLRNPLYHWTHLELDRPFGINDRLLAPDTAKGIWDECNTLLAKPEFSARGIMKQMNVALVCTTDDPVDSLEHHINTANDTSFDIPMLPTWRPDKVMAVESARTWNGWVDRLAAAADMNISSLDDLRTAIATRHQFFHDQGCRLSDRGLETAYATEYTESDLAAAFTELRNGQDISPEKQLKWKSAMLYELGVLDAEKGWTMQLHFGAMRNNNTRKFKALGPDTGFDSIGDFSVAAALSRFLDRLDREEKLPRTIIYNLNPGDNELLATMLGNFQDGSIAGKMQLGSGWWFLDQLDGMTRQIEALSQLGLLSRFVGMLTDSRSFLSYTRHDYFRRLLCNILGADMEMGLVPMDFDMVGEMVKGISYNNAATYFGFGLPTK